MKKRIAYAVSLALVALIAVVAHAATVNGGTLTLAQGNVIVQPDKTTMINLNYANASGKIVHTRTLVVDSGCTQVIDQYGNVVANPAPVALCNSISTFTSNLATIEANGAAAGKLDL